MYFPSSFRRLFDFGYQRHGLEVPVFYITYFIATIMMGAIFGNIIASLFHSNIIRAEWKLDYIADSIFMMTITYLMIDKKQLAQSTKILWILPILAAILVLWPGLSISLCIPTILSTRPKATPFTPPLSTTPPHQEYMN